LIIVLLTSLACLSKKAKKWFNPPRIFADFIFLSATQLIMVSWSQLRENTESWSFVAAIITMALAAIWTIFIAAVPIIDVFRN